MREDAGIELREPVAPAARGGEGGEDGGGGARSGDAGIDLQGGIQDEENRNRVIEQLIREHMTD